MKTLILLLAAALLHGSVAWAQPPMPGPVPQPKQIVPEALPLSPEKAPADPIQKDFKPVPLPPAKPEKKLPKSAVIPQAPVLAAEPALEAPSAAAALGGLAQAPELQLGSWFDGGAASLR